MHYILGTLALLGIGLIGLLIETHKHDKQLIKSLETRNQTQSDTITTLWFENEDLRANQKPVPWNKGKSGYKLPRKAKQVAKDHYTIGEYADCTQNIIDSQKLITPRLD